MPDKPNIGSVLLIVHALPPYEQSGTPLIAFEYAKSLAAMGIRTAVLSGARLYDPSDHLTSWFDQLNGFTRYEVCFTQPLWRQWSIYDVASSEARAASLNRVVSAFRPDIVHIVDLVNLPSEWPDALRELEVTVLRQVWNAEDLCGLIEPIWPAHDEVRCPDPITPSQCAECCFRELSTVSVKGEHIRAQNLLDELTALRKTKVDEFRQLLIAKRQRAQRHFESIYHRVIFPTASFRAFFEHTLPLAAERTAVVEPGISYESWSEVKRSNDSTEIVRFLYLGHLMTKKGFSDLVEVFTHRALTERNDYQVAIFGGDPGNLARGLLAANSGATYGGTYDGTDLLRILASGDIGLSPSRFETFHRVTREYLWAGLPVIGSTAFGIPDIIQHRQNGLLFPAGNVANFRAAVLAILDEPSLLADLRQGARHTYIRSKQEEISDLKNQYALAKELHLQCLGM